MLITSRTIHTFPKITTITTVMAAAPIIANFPIERPDESSGSHFTEPWLEPFLAKHSSWYRRHLTKTAGRRGSKDSTATSRRRRTSSAATTVHTDLSNGKRASVDEDVDGDEQWRQVEEEFKETASEHDRERRVLEV